MPICTTCTNSIPYLYTVYESSYNLRLEQCSNCLAFADPYVEHDSLTLLIDLILLKRGVYRHLLYNRGTEARRAPGRKGARGKAEEGKVLQEESAGIRETSPFVNKRERVRWLLILRLGSVLVSVDAFIRWTHLNAGQPMELSPWTREPIEALLRTLVGCFVETIAFHSGIMLACYIAMNLVDYLRSWDRTPSSIAVSGIRREFRLSLIPLTLFYSSLTKLFLLFLLAIWRPMSLPIPTNNQSTQWDGTTFNRLYISGVLQILDDDKIDREWVVRNGLGGMSAGFGLRVILDSHPIVTTIIILAGWVAKTAAASLVSGWVGGDEKTGEAWLSYSIP